MKKKKKKNKGMTPAERRAWEKYMKEKGCGKPYMKGDVIASASERK